MDELEKSNIATLRRSELASLKPITFEELEETCKKWLLIPDEGILKFLCAYVFCHRLSSKAVWAIIIGPSGGGKTEFLNAFMQLSDMVGISSITPNTFLSGMPGPNDASLLPKLTNKIMVCKDWTTMLSMQKDAKADIYSQFREIYDGDYTKIFGNGKKRSWHGKMSLLAASTQAVDLTQQQNTHLGERFINYRIVMPDRKQVAMKSLNNNKDNQEMAKELQNAVYAFFKGYDDEATIEFPPISEDLKNELVNLANFSTMARSGVIRDFGMKKEVIFVPTPEMPTRFTQQLASMALGCMIANRGPLNELDMRILYKISLDSIPVTNKMVINEMARGDKQTTADIATALGYPTEPIKMYLENLALLGICVRIKNGGVADRWTMKSEFSDIIRNYEGIAMLTDKEIDDRKFSKDNDDPDSPANRKAQEALDNFGKEEVEEKF